MRPVGLCCLLTALWSGCVHTAQVNSWKPADVDVSQLNRIAVLDFSGEHGKSIASSLASQLWQNRFYTIVDGAELGNDVEQAAFTADNTTNLAGVLDPARAKNVDGVVIGEIVDYRCNDERLHTPVLRRSQETSHKGPLRSVSGGLGFDFHDTLLREGTVTLAFRLVDVKTGEVRATREVSHHFQAKAKNVEGKLPSQGEVLEQLASQCVEDIVEMLAPHQTVCDVQLARCDVWTKGRREVQQGIDQAGHGEWDEAEQKWRLALEDEPENHAALFNLAVAAAHNQQYAQAEELAMQALRIHYRPCYAAGLETIRAHRTAFEKSEAQRGAQVPTAVDAPWQ